MRNNETKRWDKVQNWIHGDRWHQNVCHSDKCLHQDSAERGKRLSKYKSQWQRVWAQGYRLMGNNIHLWSRPTTSQRPKGKECRIICFMMFQIHPVVVSTSCFNYIRHFWIVIRQYATPCRASRYTTWHFSGVLWKRKIVAFPQTFLKCNNYWCMEIRMKMLDKQIFRKYHYRIHVHLHTSVHHVQCTNMWYIVQ